MLIGIFLIIIGLGVCSYGIWNMHKFKGWFLTLLSLPFIVLGCGIIEHTRETTFIENCHNQGWSLIKDENNKLYCKE